MKRRFLAAALACALLTGCGPVRTEPADTESAPADEPVIAYVPLDDRPDNAERVVYLADSLGYELLLPEADDYHTALDGQPLNENGTQSGDRADLFEWVLAQEEAGCDRYILSLDQLLSGGLVNSRAMAAEEPVTLSDGRTLGELELLEELIAVLAADENNRVWLLDTVMRLAATTGYGGFGLNEYNALRAYGMAPRPHLTGAALTVENIAADYPLGADGAPVPVEAEEPLPEGAVEDYLSARERKLRLSDDLFRSLEGTAEGPVPGAHWHRRLVGGGQHPEKRDRLSAEPAPGGGRPALRRGRPGLQGGGEALSGRVRLGGRPGVRPVLRRHRGPARLRLRLPAPGDHHGGAL